MEDKKMAFEFPKINYTGKIKEISLGPEAKKIAVGGERVYPFYTFEGEIPHLQSLWRFLIFPRKIGHQAA